MVNVSLDLADDVVCTPAASWKLTVSGGSECLPVDERNLAWRAAAALASPGAPLAPVHVAIAKHIPVGAGLAGGSADAAAVLRLLGRGRTDLAVLGLGLGADVPYCLDGRPAVVAGIGERITPFILGLPLHLVVANPGFAVATRDIFGALDAPPLRSDGDSSSATSTGERLSAALSSSTSTDDIRVAAAFMENDLQPVTSRLHPEIEALVKRIEDSGAFKAQMSGSGPTIFGLYADRDAAEAAAIRLARHAPFVRAVAVVSRLNIDPVA